MSDATKVNETDPEIAAAMAKLGGKPKAGKLAPLAAKPEPEKESEPEKPAEPEVKQSGPEWKAEPKTVSEEERRQREVFAIAYSLSIDMVKAQIARGQQPNGRRAVSQALHLARDMEDALSLFQRTGEIPGVPMPAAKPLSQDVTEPEGEQIDEPIGTAPQDTQGPAPAPMPTDALSPRAVEERRMEAELVKARWKRLDNGNWKSAKRGMETGSTKDSYRILERGDDDLMPRRPGGR